MAPRSKEQNQAQREQTKQSIIITALQAFAQKVYAAASINYIAQEAGISKGLIYHYFNNKEDLLLDIFDYLNSFSAALFVKMENRSPKEQLRDTIEMTFHYLETQAQLVRFMTALALQPDAMSIPSQRFQTMKEHNIKTYVQLFSNLG